MEQKISIVTPVFNGEKYLEKCILSVMNQNYQNYEHIIVDGGSTDGTLSVIKKYDGKYPMKWISEKDNGMYDAIRKGFAMADGDIFAWLNSDDVYFPWTFSVVNNTISNGVKWCTGMNAIQNENDILFAVRNIRYYKQKWLSKGYYGRVFGTVVQQESTFWSRELWEKADTERFGTYHLAGDWMLWREFAKQEPLYSVSTVIGCFRIHDGQLSSAKEKYYEEICDSCKPGKIKRVALRMIFPIYNRLLPYMYDKKSRLAARILKRIDVSKSIGSE